MSASMKESPAPLREPIVIPPKGSHTCTVILLHGNYGDAADFHGGSENNAVDAKVSELLEEIGGKLDGIKFMYLNAPKRTLHWRKFTPGEEDDSFEPDSSTWYDYFSMNLAAGKLDFDDINEEHLQQVTEHIHDLIRTEAKQLGGSHRVIIGGNSQGGTVAGHVMCTFDQPLGGLIFMRTILIEQTPVKKTKAMQTPVFVFMDEYDCEYVPHKQHEAYKRLSDAGANVTIHIEKKCDHYMASKAELYHCAKWIALCANGQDLKVTYEDAANLPEDAMAHLPEIHAIMQDVPAHHVRQQQEKRGCCLEALPAEGDRVQAKDGKAWTCNETGFKLAEGEVVLVHSLQGDCLKLKRESEEGASEAFSGKVKRANFCHASQASQADAERGIAANMTPGRRVRVIQAFNSTSIPSVLIEADQRGRIEQESDGWALIKFDGIQRMEWVSPESKAHLAFEEQTASQPAAGHCDNCVKNCAVM